MQFALAGAAAVVLIAVVAFCLLFRRLFSRQRDAQSDLEWCREFSVVRYRPMERLFAQEDYKFLAAQPGYHPSLYRKLQAERRVVLRHYLRCVSRDFARLSGAARFLLVHAAHDRSDLAAGLIKQRAIFLFAVAAVHCRLAFQPLGIRVDVRPLVGSLETMREQLRLVSQRAQPSLA